MSALTGVSRRLLMALVSLAALTAIVVPATSQAHPVQNKIILTSPPDGSCVGPTPTLEWQPRLHADKYRVKLFRDNPDGSETLRYYPWVYGTYNTSWTVPEPLEEGWYHWGVRGSNDHHGTGGYGDGPWSDPWYFYVHPSCG